MLTVGMRPTATVKSEIDAARKIGTHERNGANTHSGFARRGPLSSLPTEYFMLSRAGRNGNEKGMGTLKKGKAKDTTQVQKLSERELDQMVETYLVRYDRLNATTVIVDPVEHLVSIRE